jgi:hypothetical protein
MESQETDYESLVAALRRLAADSERLAAEIPAAMNEAYTQGVRDCQKALTGLDTKVPRDE